MIHHHVHPHNPQQRFLEQAAASLKQGGICVYPTDTVYGLGACATNPKALDRIARLLQKDKQRLFSFIFADISQMSAYVKISNAHFKLLKRLLPGPYTFILPATNFVPKKVCPKRITVGVRIPDSPACLKLVELLGEPLANTSIEIPGALRGDSDTVRDAVLNEVDIMLDAGPLSDPRGSTIVDLTQDEPIVVREGKGSIDW
jgi:tRNA threonylcarbamoyl adenosine modification protein (Sua5/YciO/YrdC/YwlC family)